MDFTVDFICRIHYGFHLCIMDFIMDFTEIKGISWNPEVSKNFMKSNRIWLKSTGFHKISQNFTIKISWSSTGFHQNQWGFYYGFHCGFHLQISLWILLDDFIMWNGFFHYEFHDKFNEIQQDFMKSTGFYWKQQDFIIDFALWISFADLIMDFMQNSPEKLKNLT